MYVLHALRNGSTEASARVARHFRARQIYKLARELQPEQQQRLTHVAKTISIQWWAHAYQATCRTRCSVLVDALLLVEMARAQGPVEIPSIQSPPCG